MSVIFFKGQIDQETNILEKNNKIRVSPDKFFTKSMRLYEYFLKYIIFWKVYDLRKNILAKNTGERGKIWEKNSNFFF